MTQTPNLRIPGPTPVPPGILEAVGHPMVNHRGREFASLIQRVAERLKDFFLTSNDVLILSASGAGGIESAVVNTLSPGDKVLAVSIGSFGERFAAIAEGYGADVTMLPAEVLIRGLATMGIIALLDEATGYQELRAKNALAKVLEEFVAKGFKPVRKHFQMTTTARCSGFAACDTRMTR